MSIVLCVNCTKFLGLNVFSMVELQSTIYAASKIRLSGMSEQHKQISTTLAQAHHAAQAGDIEAAVRWARLAGKQAPNDPLPKLLLGDIELAFARFPAAAKHYREALRCKPDLVAGHGNLGVALLRQGQFLKATECFKRVLRLHPNDASALLNLGYIAQAQGQAESALRYYQQVIAAAPEHAEAYNNAAVLYLAATDNAQAIDLLQKAVQIDPGYAEAQNNLGNALRAQGRLGAAIEAYRIAANLQPEHPGVWNNLGNALIDQGDLDQGMALLERAITPEANYPAAISNWLMAQNYQPHITLEALHQAHTWLGPRFGTPSNANFKCKPGEALRIGFVSPDFRQHPVAHLIEPVLATAARSALEIFCYSDVDQGDAVTARLKAYGHAWRDLHGKSDEMVADMVRRDGVCILIDLAGHTAQARPRLFARRAAPVQVSWLGYFSTTGLAAMDYFIGDAVSTPLAWQRYFTEKLVLLPHTRFCYRPPLDAPATAQVPSASGKPFTFGCFNNLAKLNSDVLTLWSKVLRAIPDSRLILRARFLDDEDTRQALIARWQAAGAPLDRIQMFGQVPHAQLLQAYAEIDLALDPFPFGGGMTTLEALWMGVPVLTLMGDRPAGRQSASFMLELELPQFVADSSVDYLRRAIEIPANPDALASIRETLRERMRASSLCDEQGFTRDLEVLLKLL